MFSLILEVVVPRWRAGRWVLRHPQDFCFLLEVGTSVVSIPRHLLVGVVVVLSATTPSATRTWLSPRPGLLHVRPSLPARENQHGSLAATRALGGRTRRLVAAMPCDGGTHASCLHDLSVMILVAWLSFYAGGIGLS